MPLTITEFMTFKSCAQWPDECCPAIGNYSDDTHGTREEAEAVCQRLHEHGFGGDGQFFPVRTWVEPLQTTDELRQDLSDRERALQDTADLTLPHIDMAINLLLEAREALALRRGVGTASAILPLVHASLDDAANHLPDVALHHLPEDGVTAARREF